MKTLWGGVYFDGERNHVPSLAGEWSGKAELSSSDLFLLGVGEKSVLNIFLRVGCTCYSDCTCYCLYRPQHPYELQKTLEGTAIEHIIVVTSSENDKNQPQLIKLLTYVDSTSNN